MHAGHGRILEQTADKTDASLDGRVDDFAMRYELVQTLHRTQSDVFALRVLRTITVNNSNLSEHTSTVPNVTHRQHLVAIAAQIQIHIHQHPIRPVHIERHIRWHLTVGAQHLHRMHSRPRRLRQIVHHPDAGHLQKLTTPNRIAVPMHRMFQHAQQLFARYRHRHNVLVERHNHHQIGTAQIARRSRRSNAATVVERDGRIRPRRPMVTRHVRIDHRIGDQIAEIAFAKFARAVQEDARLADDILLECGYRWAEFLQQMQHLRIARHAGVQQQRLAGERFDGAVGRHIQVQHAEVFGERVRLHNWDAFAGQRLADDERIGAGGCFQIGLVAVPQERVVVAADDDVDVRTVVGDLFVGGDAAVPERDDQVDAVGFEAGGFLAGDGRK